MSILIFSRPIHTGKTTELLRWCSGKKNIAGIAMPDIDGLRKIMDLRSGEIIDAELDESAMLNAQRSMLNAQSPELPIHHSPFTIHDSESIIQIGKFAFLRSAFEKANELLLKAWNSKPDWLIIDELGKLELKGEGFSPAVEKIFSEYKQPMRETNILIVIREGLVNELVKLFKINDYSVVFDLRNI